MAAASLLRRLLLAAMTVLAGGLISATLARYAPGFGMDERQLDARLSSASLEALRQTTAEERGIVSYYVKALGRAVRGDLGVSRSLERPIRELLAERAGVTCRLAARAMLLAWGAALLLLSGSWLLRVPAVSTGATLLSGALLCLPAGALALLSVVLNAPGYLALALVLYPKIHRYLNSMIAGAAAMPHVITARAKGISQFRILLWHVLPVVRREILALLGVSVGLAISAAIPIEALCGIAGIGQLAWQSALARDLPLLINLSMLVIAAVTLANGGADLLSGERRPA